MSSETQQNESSAPSSRLLAGLSMIGGVGITLIMVALGAGVVLRNADSSVVGLLVLAGFLLLVMSVGGWFIVVQPHKNFDDINVAQYHGHHHEEHHEAHDEAEEAHH